MKVGQASKGESKLPPWVKGRKKIMRTEIEDEWEAAPLEELRRGREEEEKKVEPLLNEIIRSGRVPDDIADSVRKKISPRGLDRSEWGNVGLLLEKRCLSGKASPDVVRAFWTAMESGQEGMFIREFEGKRELFGLLREKGIAEGEAIEAVFRPWHHVGTLNRFAPEIRRGLATGSLDIERLRRVIGTKILEEIIKK